MTLGIQEAAEAILAASAEDLEAALGWPIVLREADRSSDLDVDDQGEMVAFMFTNLLKTPAAAFALERGGSVAERGSLQISIRIPASRGDEEAGSAGSAVCRLFPRLTRLGGARVDRPSWAAAPLQDGPYNLVPVTVPWTALVREGDR